MKFKFKKITFFLPSLAGGGAEKVFVNLANEFQERGLQVHFVLAKEEGPYLKDVKKGVDVFDLGTMGLFHIFKFSRHLKKEKPDVIISGLPRGNIPAIWANILSGRKAKHLISEHSYFSVAVKDSRNITKFLITPTARLSYKRVDSVVAVSEGVVDDLVKTTKVLKETVKVIYNPIFSDDILKKAEEDVSHPFFREEGAKVVLGVGRLRLEKDFDLLIGAFSDAYKNDSSLRLIILGEGRERVNLELLIESLGLKEKVSLPGFTTNPYAYMRKADVFVLSSRREGFGNVLVEAMACGTPVLSTNCLSGPSEILKDGEYGYLTDVGDRKGLQEAIEKTLEEPLPSARLVARARDFSVKKIAEDYLEEINRLF